MWRHPKYYKELRKLRNNSDQAISTSDSTECSDKRAPGPGLKQQAASDKLQAPSLVSVKRQASSPKLQASSCKPQAASSKILEPRYMDTEKVFLGKGPRAFTMMKVLCG